MTRTTKALIFAVSLLGMLVPASTAAAKLRILAPHQAPATRPIHFAAAPSRPTEKVSFYVDGTRRFVDRSPSWEFGRDGYLWLRPGRHVLKVRALQPGRIVTTTRPILIDPPQTEVGGAVAEAPSEQVAGPEAEAGQETTASPADETAPSAPPAPAPAGDLLFSGSRISDFAFNQSAPSAVSEVADPAGSGARVLKMTVDNADVAPITPTHDPRAQLVTPAFVNPGDETWWHTRFYLPANFPSNVPGWVTVLGAPTGPRGTARRRSSISVDDNEIRFQRNETYAADIPWQEPIQRGKWIDVLFHTRFGHDGFVELWIDGKQVTFFEDSPHNPLHEGPDPAPRHADDGPHQRRRAQLLRHPELPQGRHVQLADRLPRRDRGRHDAAIGRRLSSAQSSSSRSLRRAR